MSAKKKDFYSSREVAKLLGVAVSTIQLWTNNGLLRAWTTNGGHRRIACGSVEEILKQQKKASGGLKGVEQLSVMILEGDERQQRLYKKQFQAWHLDTKIVTARDGFEGLIKIGHVIPDVIISDLKMPDIDAFQMIKVLKGLPELTDSLIIAVTGLTRREIKKKGGVPEGVHVFTKPVPFNELEVLLRDKVSKKVA